MLSCFSNRNKQQKPKIEIYFFNINEKLQGQYSIKIGTS